MAEDERPRFLPPTSDPPRYGQSAAPARPTEQRRSDAAAEPSNGLAVASLTLSIVGLGLLLVTLGLLSVVSVPCSILGWLFGHRARQRPGEQGLARSGLVIGIVGTVLGVAAIVVWVLLVVAADNAWDGWTVD